MGHYVDDSTLRELVDLVAESLPGSLRRRYMSAHSVFMALHGAELRGLIRWADENEYRAAARLALEVAAEYPNNFEEE